MFQSSLEVTLIEMWEDEKRKVIEILEILYVKVFLDSLEVKVLIRLVQ